MIDKVHVEKFLKLNGLSSSSPEEDIRALLQGARWHEDDIEDAITVLHDSEDTPSRSSHQLNNAVFNSDKKLNPETISALLGVDVAVNTVVSTHYDKMTRQYRKQLISIGLVSIFGSVIALLAVMWFMKVGIFHEFAALKF